MKEENAAPELKTQVQRKEKAKEKTPTANSKLSPLTWTPYFFSPSKLQFDTTALTSLIQSLWVAALVLP